MKQQTYLVTEYDRESGMTGALLLILTVEDSVRGKYSSGDSIFVNGKEFVLGECGFDKKNSLVMYELNRRKNVVLPLE